MRTALETAGANLTLYERKLAEPAAREVKLVRENLQAELRALRWPLADAVVGGARMVSPVLVDAACVASDAADDGAIVAADL